MVYVKSEYQIDIIYTNHKQCNLYLSDKNKLQHFEMPSII